MNCLYFDHLVTFCLPASQTDEKRYRGWCIKRIRVIFVLEFHNYPKKTAQHVLQMPCLQQHHASNALVLSAFTT